MRNIVVKKMFFATGPGLLQISIFLFVLNIEDLSQSFLANITLVNCAKVLNSTNFFMSHVWFRSKVPITKTSGFVSDVFPMGLYFLIKDADSFKNLNHYQRCKEEKE